MLCVCVYMCGSWFGQELATCHALAASRTRCAEPRCVSMNNTMNECKQRDSGGKESMQIDNAQCHSSPVEHLRYAVQNTQMHISKTDSKPLNIYSSLFTFLFPLMDECSRTLKQAHESDFTVSFPSHIPFRLLRSDIKSTSGIRDPIRVCDRLRNPLSLALPHTSQSTEVF